MRVAVAVALLALAACGKSDKKQQSGPGPEPSTGVAAASGLDIPGFCKKTMAAANPDQCWGKDASSTAIRVSFCIDVLRTAQQAGRIAIDPAGLAACEAAAVAGLASLPNARGVDVLAERFPACRSVTTGKVAPGGACVGAMECADGLVCGQMVWNCEPAGKVGDKCFPVIEMTMATAPDSTCGAGLYCDFSDGCKPRGAAGAACRRSEQCGDGLRCRDQTCVTAAPSAAGGQCDDHPDCPAGHACTLFGKRCEPRKPDGEKCASNEECLNTCVTGDSISGTCGPCA